MSEELCIECNGVKNLSNCKTCEEIVCLGCMFNHNQEEVLALND